MLRRTWIAKLFAAAIAVAAVGGSAQAGMVPGAVLAPTPEAGNFRWTYSVVLPTNEALLSGNFFTIYNVGGFLPGTIVAPTGWTASVGLKTTPPAGLFPHDNGTLPDITFTYSGPTIPTGQVGLGNFWFDSTFSTSTAGDFTAQNPQASTGNIDRNIVSTLVPGAPSSGGGGGTPGVPEPATLALAGFGLPLIGAARMWRKKK